MRVLATWNNWLEKYSECTPMHYVTCQWQRNKKNAPYFLYRLLSFAWFMEALILSFIQVRYSPEYWPIYYTHWSFLLATVQSGMALVLVAMNQADAFKPSGGRKQNTVCTVYEYVHAAATTQAFGVTLLFWATVYNPKKGSPNVQTIQVHAINSVMMLLDLFLVAFPVRAITLLLPFGVSLAYLVFNYIYFIAGGTRYDGTKFIYKVLDWKKPAKAGIFSAIVAVLIIVLFLVIWCLSLLRRVLYSKIFMKRNFNISQREEETHVTTIA